MLSSIKRKIWHSPLQRIIKPFFDLSDNPDEGYIAYRCLRKTTVEKVMIDVGAHIGLSMKEFVKEGWQVYAFEPDKRHRAVLEKRFQGCTSVHIDHRAISNRNEKQHPFFFSDMAPGISTLSAFHHSHKETSSVETIRLDSYCQELNITKIGFIKIDTEGYDLFVLQSVPWEDILPEMILCEFEDRKSIPLGYDFHDIANFLKNKGYNVLVSEWYPIVEYGKQHRWRRFANYPCKLLDKNAWGNIIGVQSKELFDKVCSVAAEYQSSSF